MLTKHLIQRLISTAKNLSQNIVAKQKHVTFIVRGNKIIAHGCNSVLKTHPLAAKNGYSKANFTIHSELAALINFPNDKFRLDKCKVINIRIGNSGKLKPSEPCVVCKKLLLLANVKNMWYSDSEKFIKLQLGGRSAEDR